MDPRPTVFKFGEYRLKPGDGRLEFDYEIQFVDREPLKFTEIVEVPFDLPKSHPRGVTLAFEKILEGVHLVLGLSYYKLYIPPKIEQPYELDKGQVEFWNTLYGRGLGEFVYRNGLKFEQLARFEGIGPIRGRSDKSGATVPAVPKPASNGIEKALVGIGGGKDSIVAVELLKKEGVDMTAFVVETQRGSQIVEDVIEAAGLPKLVVKRTLDEKLFQEHPGSYNGHVPVSAMYAWLGLLTAHLTGHEWVVVGNEHSSNFGNLEYDGETINHQWSKSAESESAFQKYVEEHVFGSRRDRHASQSESRDDKLVTYFSLLRPFTELRIAQEFSSPAILETYGHLFSSCNRNFTAVGERQGIRWCCECPKCVFTWLILSAFVAKEKLIEIFGKNLFTEKALLALFKDVLGLGGLKPFDCVGTFEEAQEALRMAEKGYGDNLVVRELLPLLEPPSDPPLSGGKHAPLLRAMPAPTVPHRFRFVGMKNALILGYGREGKVTEQFLKQYYPEIEIGIADEKGDPDYLNKQVDFDITIRTPGISKDKITGHYTTATNIFFSRVPNITIGVTGTKGKSTTVSLIFAMLEAGGKDVQLLGNIGKPMLQALLTDIPKERIFVLELSSGQLEDLDFSPNVAIVVNLFPEHMDHHGSFEAYAAAKHRIIERQDSEDVFLYNDKDTRVAAWAKQARGQAIPFADEIPVADSEIPLLGEHNRRNIQAAIAVAKHFEILEEKIATAIKIFQPLPHRLENVGIFRGITFIDDAISTTPESTIAAIRAVPSVKTICLGGLDRGYDFENLAKVVKEAGIENVVLFPDSQKKLIPLLQGLNIFETDSLEKAVEFAYKVTPAGSVCLLSTASPSYNLWKNFEAQGDQFEKFVKKHGNSN